MPPSSSDGKRAAVIPRPSMAARFPPFPERCPLPRRDLPWHGGSVGPSGNHPDRRPRLSALRVASHGAQERPLLPPFDCRCGGRCCLRRCHKNVGPAEGIRNHAAAPQTARSSGASDEHDVLISSATVAGLTEVADEVLVRPAKRPDVRAVLEVWDRARSPSAVTPDSEQAVAFLLGQRRSVLLVAGPSSPLRQAPFAVGRRSSGPVRERSRAPQLGEALGAREGRAYSARRCSR